jgi:hypothetical protein
MNFVEQLSAMALLIDFLFGVIFGVVGSASLASRREDHEFTLLKAAPGPVCAGVRVIHGVYTSADEYMIGLLHGGGRAAGGNRGIDDSGSQGQELDQ